jgi:hypothetical protein
MLLFKYKEISKEKMVEFSHSQKQIWRMVLSKLEFDDFFQISSVCKFIFFMLKEDQIFWGSFASWRLNIDKLPNQYSNWKEYIIIHFSFDWDQSRFNGNFKVDEKDSKILIDLNKERNWKLAITKNPLKEGVLYPFHLLKVLP